MHETVNEIETKCREVLEFVVSVRTAVEKTLLMPIISQQSFIQLRAKVGFRGKDWDMNWVSSVFQRNLSIMF